MIAICTCRCLGLGLGLGIALGLRLGLVVHNRNLHVYSEPSDDMLIQLRKGAAMLGVDQLDCPNHLGLGLRVMWSHAMESCCPNHLGLGLRCNGVGHVWGKWMCILLLGQEVQSMHMDFEAYDLHTNPRTLT